MISKHRIFSLLIAIGCLFLWLNSSAQEEAKLYIAQNVHDFGLIEAKKGLVKHSFMVRNDGKEPLRLERVSCVNGSVTTHWAKTPIAPGESAPIEVRYNPTGQSGPFSILIDVISSASSKASMLVIKGEVRANPNAPKVPKAEFSPDQWVFDFGKIKEEDGYATHVFRIKNTGNAPMKITHVQSSCGCAEPEWSQEPIPPGGTGEVAVTYDAYRRPGPFRKNITVYSDANGGRHRLTITGEVIPEKRDERILYPDTIGGIGVQQRRFDFYLLREREIASQEMWIQNITDHEVALDFSHLPAYIHVEAPAKLEPDRPERLKVTVDGKVLHAKGHTEGHFVWKSQGTGSDKRPVTREIPVTVNLVDDFSTLSQADKDAGPALNISATVVNLSTTKKGGAKQQLTISNSGRSPLTFYSLTCAAPWIKMTGGKKKALRPGESMTLTFTIKPKETVAPMADFIVVCNDPQGPVRIVRIKTE